MWIIFFMLLGVFVVAVMGVAFWALKKEPRTEDVSEGQPKSSPEDDAKANSAKADGNGGLNDEKIATA